LNNCPCQSENTETAYTTISAGTRIQHFADESHFGAYLIQCKLCDQLFLAVFCETIDWVDGDDPQTWSYTLVTEEEADQIGNLGDSIDDFAIMKLSLPGQTLWRSFPKGEPISLKWSNGPLIVMPHD
jgi:hypothetical protein